MKLLILILVQCGAFKDMRSSYYVLQYYEGGESLNIEIMFCKNIRAIACPFDIYKSVRYPLWLNCYLCTTFRYYFANLVF